MTELTTQRWFGGVELIHEGNGRLQIAVVDSAAAAAWFASRDAELAQQIDLVPARHTLDELRSAAQEAADRLPGATVSIDEGANTLLIAIPGVTSAGNAPDGLSAELDDVRRATGVPVRSASYVQEIPEACSSRTTCDPYRAGIRIGRNSGSFNCTWGFRIKTSSGTTALWTSGHCGYNKTPNLWWADDDSLGYEEGNLYNNSTAYKDIMRVRTNLANEPTTDDIYGKTNDVAGWEWPVTGSTVCASLGKSAVWDCGTVSTSATTYTDTNGVFNYAADHNGIATQGGDSGSPIVRDSGSGYYIAVGVHSTSGGKFARVNDVASGSGWFIY